jgi:5-enolpyruvylshikimate-3-phosphate synthase
MAFAIAALGATGDTLIRGASASNFSFPGFFDVLHGLAVHS